MATGIDWHLTFEGFKVVADPIAQASWPIAIAWGLWFFSADIRAMLGRLKSIKGGGVEAELQADGQQAEAAPLKEGAKLPSGFGNEYPPPDAVLQPMDEHARNILDSEITGDQNKLLAWAIRMRSISEVKRFHEANYRVMFGSQLKAIQRLNINRKVNDTIFRNIFEEAKNNPETSAFHVERSFEDWVRFILDTGYAAIVKDSNPTELAITPLGQNFLMWMTSEHVSDFRPG